MDIMSTLQMCIFAHSVTSGFEVFEEPVDVLSMQGQTKGSDSIHSLLCSLKKHNFETISAYGHSN
jgi:hypothetical protein